MATGLIQEVEEALGRPWPFLSLALFQDYFYSGNRKRYEELYFAKRKNLCSLVLAECVENKGRFLDPISEGIWSIISEVSWVLPAHNTYKRDTQQLDDVVYSEYSTHCLYVGSYRKCSERAVPQKCEKLRCVACSIR